jgi:putative ABC transport system permease protein
MGVRLERGRFFNDFDSDKAQRVCIVDTMFATKEWPGQDPVGRRVATRGFPEKPEWMTVVGVVSHVMNYGVDQPSRVEIYEPDAQQPRSFGSIIVRTKADPASLVSAVKSAIVEVNPNVPLFDVQPLSDVVDANVASRRLSSVLLGVFAALALVLAAIGIYGVMSYMVTQRLHEIGIRIALGAQRKDVLGIVLGNGMTLLAAGLAIGFAGAFSLSRFMEALLFQVKATDAATFATIPIVLAMVALAACYIPARRAMRVDPIIALREE